MHCGTLDVPSWISCGPSPLFPPPPTHKPNTHTKTTLGFIDCKLFTCCTRKKPSTRRRPPVTAFLARGKLFAVCFTGFVVVLRLLPHFTAVTLVLNFPFPHSFDAHSQFFLDPSSLTVSPVPPFFGARLVFSLTISPPPFLPAGGTIEVDRLGRRPFRAFRFRELCSSFALPFNVDPGTSRGSDCFASPLPSGLMPYTQALHSRGFAVTLLWLLP